MKKFFSILLAICLFVGLLTGCSGGGKAKHEIPDAPPCYVQLERNGEVYEEYAVQGQVWLLFNPFVTPQQAERILSENKARILDAEPEIGYYLVEVRAGTESEFISQMSGYWEVDYVYPNAIYEAQSVSPYVLDNFNGPHGAQVVKMMREASSSLVQPRDIASGDSKGFVSDGKIKRELREILSLDYETPNESSIVVNMSIGPGLGRNSKGEKRRWYHQDVTDKMKQSYINRYIREIVGPVKYLYAHYSPNIKSMLNCVEDFVIIKAAGNEGMKYMEVIFDGIRKELSPQEWYFFKEHFLIVSAKDDHKGKDNNVDYPNDVYYGGYEDNFSKVDISDKTVLDTNWCGTSFASPRLAGYIVRAANEYNLKATEVLPFVRRATRNAFGHVVDYEMIEAEIKDFYGIYQQSPTNANTVCGHTTSTLPASLVGTKWHFTGGSSAFSYDRTFEFISTSQIRFSEVTKDLFFGGTETKEKIWDYYYDSSIDRIVLMSTNCFGDTMYMHMMYDGNAMYYSIPGMAGRNEFFSEKYQRCN